MAKTKHIHVIEVTVTLRKPYEANNLAAALEAENTLMASVKKLDGYAKHSIRMTKVPVKADGLDVPAGMKRV